MERLSGDKVADLANSESYPAPDRAVALEELLQAGE
jgi:hypothetical protein